MKDADTILSAIFELKEIQKKMQMQITLTLDGMESKIDDVKETVKNFSSKLEMVEYRILNVKEFLNLSKSEVLFEVKQSKNLICSLKDLFNGIKEYLVDEVEKKQKMFKQNEIDSSQFEILIQEGLEGSIIKLKTFIEQTQSDFVQGMCNQLEPLLAEIKSVELQKAVDTNEQVLTLAKNVQDVGKLVSQVLMEIENVQVLQTTQSEELKAHRTMLKDILIGRYKVPAYFLLLPSLQSAKLTKTVKKWFFTTSRLVFICPITLCPVSCGKEGTGYEISQSKEWVRRLGWALKISLYALKLALTATGHPLPIPNIPSEILEVNEFLSNLDEVVSSEMNLEPGENNIGKAIKEDKHSISYETIRKFLFDYEEKDKKTTYTDSWLPNKTGLQLTLSDNDGTTAWVSKPQVNTFKERGAESLQITTG